MKFPLLWEEFLCLWECAMIVGTATLNSQENNLLSRIKYKYPTIQKDWKMIIST